MFLQIPLPIYGLKFLVSPIENEFQFLTSILKTVPLILFDSYCFDMES